MAEKSYQVLLLALVFLCQDVCAQNVDPSPFALLTIDAGIHFYAIEAVDRPYIRRDLPASGFLGEGIRGEMTAQFAGAKAEKFFFQHRLSFSVGLRYTNRMNSIYKNSVIPDYFYVLHRQEATTTEYLRVGRIEESLRYIGLPLEARLYINPRRRWFLMAGGEWSYQIAHEIKVAFKDPDMKMFTKDVKALVGDASGHYSSFYMGAGVRLGEDRPRWTLGLNVPLATTRTVSGVLTPRFGGAGIHVQYLLSRSHMWYEKE